MTTKRFFSRIGILVITGTLVVFPCLSLADTLKLKEGAPEHYTVVKGDTLWDISGQYLDQPWRWPELWDNNPQIADPHLIYPGDVISLVYTDGQPRLQINNRVTKRVKLSPRIRSTPIDDAIPVIPLEDIRPFLEKVSILDKTIMDKAPYIVGGEEQRILLAKGDRAYIRGLEEETGTKDYEIYRMGDAIKDPATGKTLAYEGIHTGSGRLDAAGDPATLLITDSRLEAAIGDRLVAIAKSEEIFRDFFPKAPESRLEGQILRVVYGSQYGGLHSAVIINLGQKDGLRLGDVLSIYSKGKTIRDIVSTKPDDSVTVPDQRAGTLIVVNAFDQISYGLILESRLPARVLDIVRTPE